MALKEFEDDFENHTAQLWLDMTSLADDIFYTNKVGAIFLFDSPDMSRRTPAFKNSLQLKCEKGKRTALLVDYRITVRYDEELSRTVTDSSELVVKANKEQILFRLDYSRAPSADVLKSHYNVYGHSEAYLKALNKTVTKKISKNSKPSRFFKRWESGNVTGLEHLHLPTGEPHFRPSIEEMLYCLANEFALKYQPNGRKMLETMIKKRKERQIISFMLDNRPE